MNQEAVRRHRHAARSGRARGMGRRTEDAPAACDERPDFVRNIVDVMNCQEATSCP